MNRFLSISLICSLSFNTFAGRYDDALTSIKKNLELNTQVYEQRFRISHEARVSDFFYRRTLTRQIISQEMIEGAFLDYSLVSDVANSINYKNSDLDELYMISKSTHELASKTRLDMEASYAKLLLINESLEDDCANSNLSIVTDRFDPLASYPIPTIVRDAEGAPSYNFSFEMNFNYAYNDGGGDPSTSVDTKVGPNSGVSGAVGAITAGVVCAVASIGTAGGAAPFVCSPAGFALVAGIVASVFDYFTSRQEFEEFQEKLDDEYKKANSRIRVVHENLHNENNEIVFKACSKIDMEIEKKNLSVSLNVLENYIAYSKQIEEFVAAKEVLILSILDKDEATLKMMFVAKRAKFLNMINTTMQTLKKEYAKNGIALQKFYATELFPVSKKVKNSVGLSKIRHQGELMKLLAKGDMLFGDNIGWNGIKRGVR